MNIIVKIAELFKNKDGSLTVEASIALPFFIAFVVVVASVMKVIYVHNQVQIGLNQASKQLSNYFYIYSVSGIQKLHDTAVGSLDKSQQDFASDFVSVLDAFNSTEGLKERTDVVTEAVWSVEDSKDVFLDKEGPEKGFINKMKSKALSPVSFFTLAGIDKGKDIVGNIMIKFLIDKHFSSETESSKERFERLNVIGGIEGLTYKSKILEDKKSIEVIITYDVKPVVPFDIFPRVHLANRTCVNALLDGDGKYAKKSKK